MPLGAAIGMIGNIASTSINNQYAEEREQKARADNFQYNEKAANAADERTRRLYSDLYSPKAQMQQLKETGLSPSIFASGGLAGKSGVSGAQGQGAGGISPNVFAADPIGAAVAASQIQKTKAEAKKLEGETNSIELKNSEQKYRNALLKYEEFTARISNEITTNLVMNDNGVEKTIYDYATESETYKQFNDRMMNANYDNHPVAKTFLKTEAGQKQLRTIYYEVKQHENEMQLIETSLAEAKLREQIANALDSQDYSSTNAEAIIASLKASIEASQLTSQQKGAWNELLEGIENKSIKNGLIILGMLLSNVNVSTNYSKIVK